MLELIVQLPIGTGRMKKKIKQAGAELCQAQVKLRLAKLAS